MPKRKSNWWCDHEVKAPKAVTTVQVIESERGWGQKVDAEHYFDDREAAEAYRCSLQRLSWYVFQLQCYGTDEGMDGFG